MPCLHGKLGAYGGPSSLPCGHNGCLQCLQQVQAHNPDPLCPLCRTPFDAELNLGPNLDFKEMLEKLQLASSGAIRLDEGVLYNQGDQYRHHPHQGIGSQAPMLTSWNATVDESTLLKGGIDGSAYPYSTALCDGRS